MTHAVTTELSHNPLNPRAQCLLPPLDEIRIREALRRCSAQTLAAAHEFQKTGNLDCVPVVIEGVIEHYVDPDAREKLRKGGDDLGLIKDLGIDSLTLLEIVFLAEEVLQVSIENDELRPFCTVGDVKKVILAKVCGAS